MKEEKQYTPLFIENDFGVILEASKVPSEIQEAYAKAKSARVYELRGNIKHYFANLTKKRKAMATMKEVWTH